MMGVYGRELRRERLQETPGLICDSVSFVLRVLRTSIQQAARDPIEKPGAALRSAEATGVEYLARRTSRSAATVGKESHSTPENSSGVSFGHEVMLRTCEG